VQIEPRTNDDPVLLSLVAAQQRELAEAEASAGGFDGGYAAARGHTRTRLETGSYLPVALGLYRAAGYRAIPAFGEYIGNPDSRCFEKDPIGVTMAFHERAGRT
jgi:hypothetical protein